MAQLTKSSDELTIKAYFQGVLKLAHSNEQYPVSLDEVWPLVYSRKSDAVENLTANFLQDVDYQVLRQNPQNPLGGRPATEYRLTTACLEYFIARKVRPVFEVYRAVFHQTAAQPPQPQNFAEALRLAADQWEQLQAKDEKLLEQTSLLAEQSAVIADQTNAIAAMQEKVSYLDRILASPEPVCITAIAQDYGLSAKAFNALLASLHIQRKVDGQWILYAEYLPCGYVHSKTIEITRSDGSKATRMHTYWRQKGRIFLYGKLKEHGVVPLIEQPSK